MAEYINGVEQQAGVTSGLIVMWHGAIAAIPAGYVICDGNNSSPNLLANFIRQVATAATEPGGTGGANTVALTTAQLAAHTHSYTYKDRAENLSAAGTYQAWIDTTTINTGSAGSGSAHQNMPAYFALAFLMKT